MHQETSSRDCVFTTIGLAGLTRTLRLATFFLVAISANAQTSRGTRGVDSPRADRGAKGMTGWPKTQQSLKHPKLYSESIQAGSEIALAATQEL